MNERTKIDLTHLVLGHVGAAIADRLDPDDWPLPPYVKMVVAREGDDQVPGWARRIYEAYSPHLEAAWDKAPFAALVVEPRRALILPFELLGAYPEPEEEDPDEPEAEIPTEKVRHLPDEVLLLPPATFDPALIEVAPTLHVPPIETAARRIFRRELQARYGEVPSGIEFVRHFGGHVTVPALPDREAVRTYLNRVLSLTAAAVPWRLTAWEENLASLLADPGDLVGENWFLALYRTDTDGAYELLRILIPAEEIRKARPTVHAIDTLSRGLSGRFDHPRGFAEFLLSLVSINLPVRAWVYLAPGDDPHREAKRALLARAGKIGSVLLRAWDKLPNPLGRPVLLTLFEGEEEPRYLYEKAIPSNAVQSARDPKEEVFLRDSLA